MTTAMNAIMRATVARGCISKAQPLSRCAVAARPVPRMRGSMIKSLQLQLHRVRPGTAPRRLMCNASGEAAPAAASPEAPAPTAEAEYDKVDLRVGKILKAWVHPDADSLYVEEVDVGEPEGPRTICSGLVKYVAEEELADKLVVVVANLKARNMRGIKSHGMLLAASDEAHENVELLTVPEGAQVGERVKFGSPDAVQGDAFSPNKLQKKKVWDAVGPKLNTSEDKVVRYEDLTMYTSAGAVTTATLANGRVS